MIKVFSASIRKGPLIRLLDDDDVTARQEHHINQSSLYDGQLAE